MTTKPKWKRGHPNKPAPPASADLPEVQVVRLERNGRDVERDQEQIGLTRRQTAAGERQADAGDEQVLLARRQLRVAYVGTSLSVLALVGVMISLLFTRTSLDLSRVSTEAAKSQADTARTELNSSQRPWVSIELTGARLQITPASAAVVARAIVKNLGHSVAENYMFWPILIADESTTGRECQDKAEALAQSSHPDGGVLFPDQAAVVQIPNAVEFSGKQFYPNMPGVHAFDLVACVVYTSPLDKQPHWTEQRFFLGKDRTQFKAGFNGMVQFGADVNGTMAK